MVRPTEVMLSLRQKARRHIPHQLSNERGQKAALVQTA